MSNIIKKEDVNLVNYEGDDGFEDIDIQLTPPTAKLVQKTGDNSDPTLQGKVVDSVTNEILPETFIPIKLWNDRVCWLPKNATELRELKSQIQSTGIEVDDVGFDEEVVCRSNDNIIGTTLGNCNICGLSEFKNGIKPYCTKVINVLGLFEGNALPHIIRFFKTSFNAGVQFVRTARILNIQTKKPLFACKYKLTTKKVEKNSNSWYVLDVKPNGYCVDEEIQIAVEMRNQFERLNKQQPVTEEDC